MPFSPLGAPACFPLQFGYALDKAVACPHTD